MNEALFDALSRQQAVHAANARTNTGLQKYNGNWSNIEVQHLLKRTLFGSTKKDIDQFTAAGMGATLDAILNYSSVLPAPPLNDYNSSSVNDPAVPAVAADQ